MTRRAFSSVPSLLLLLGSLPALPLAAQEKPTAFVGAKLLPASREPIASGTLLVHLGKILAAGPADSVAIPADATRIDAAGKVIIPGLICTHSHLGGMSGADGSSPIQPDVRVLDSINVLDAGFRRAVAGGLTTLNIMPGSGHLLSGRTVYVKLRGGKSIEDIAYRGADGQPLGGVKMANGTNSRRAPPFPGTRAKSAALVRSMFLQAREYRDKVARAAGDAEKLPPRDLGLETLVEVLRGEMRLLVTAHRAQDISSALRLAEELKVPMVLDGAAEAGLLVERIRAAGVPVILHPPLARATRDLENASFETASILRRAGIPFALQSGYESYVPKTRVVLFEAAIAAANGLSFEEALASITIDAARILGVDARIGSLVVGKDGDLALYDGDPFEYTTHCTGTIIDGEVVSAAAQ